MLVLRKDERHKLKEPLGDLFPNFDDVIDYLDKDDFIISVGDVTTRNLIDSGLHPNLGIIDNFIQRKESDTNLNYDTTVLKCLNPAGTLTDSLWETIEKVLDSNNSGNYLIVVEGEEDLAVLPCILMCPKEAKILYGQPNEGVVLVNAKTMISKAEELLNIFEEA